MTLAWSVRVRDWPRALRLEWRIKRLDRTEKLALVAGTRQPPAASASSLGAQRDRRIDPRGPPGRLRLAIVAAAASSNGMPMNVSGSRARHVEQQVRHQLGGGQRDGQPQRDADPGQQDRLAHHQPQHVRLAGAQGHAHAQLARCAG